MLAISRGCKFCNASAPFYQNLLQSANPAGVAVVAITEDSDLEKTREHFANLGVVVQEIRTVEFSKVGVRVTPTLIVVDRNGRVKRSWAGEIKPGDQQEVLSLISSAKAGPRSSLQKHLNIPGGDNEDDSRAHFLNAAIAYSNIDPSHFESKGKPNK